MSCPETFRRLARRLDRAADRVGEVGDQLARRVAAATWECPRGRRATRRAGELAVAARAGAADLRAAAGEFRQAAAIADGLRVRP